MKVKKRLSRMIAGITAFMLVLTPLPLDELGVLANGISMTVNAEENGDPNENGANTGSENGEGGENGTNTGSENGEGGENGTNTGSENGEDGGNDTNTDANTEDTAFNAKNNVTEGDEEQGEISISLASLGLPDNDELFEGYVYRAFYGNTSFYAYQGSGYNSLSTDAEKEIYDLLKPELSKIANGQRASTSIEITLTNSWTSTSDSLHRITWALLTDFPYDVYWFDKTSGLGLSYIGNTYTFNFSVASDYAGSSAYTVNTTKTGAASSSAANAQTIVNNYAALSDFEKLDGYRAEICGLVEYNNDALAVGTPYGDPWQLIYVFDGNSSTNVVCEGYSKAFQYLCNLTEFDNDTIECALVTGTMVANGSGGGHMWNIVSIDDVSYVVDVTNCDSGTVGYPDELFLKGMTNVSGDGFTAALSSNVVYTYDTDTKATFDSTFLTVSAKDYSESSIGTYDEVQITIKSGYLNWAVNDSKMSDYSATLSKNDTVTIWLNLNDYINHKLTINGAVAALKLADDNSYVYTTISIDGSVEEISVDYVESAWSSDELAKYAQLTVGENINVFPYNDGTNESASDLTLKTGDYYPKNESIFISVALNDYINHKVVVNGNEVELYINGDNTHYCGSYIVADSNVTVELQIEQWSDEKLSEFVNLYISENLNVYPYNQYTNTSSLMNPLKTGDYYPRGQKLVIMIPDEAFNGEAIIINGVKVFDGSVQFCQYPVNCNSDTLTIGLESEYAKLNVGENVNVYALNEETGDADTSISFKTGDYCLKNEKIFISVKLNDYIDHKLVVNGNDVELSINGDNVCYCSPYTVTGSNVTVELQTEKWSDEKLSQYVKLEVGETVNVYPYNEFSDSAVLGCQLHTGDYYPKNKKLVIRIPEDVRNGKAILINGVQVDGEVNGNGDYQIWKYLVDCSGNTLTINTESALNLTEKNGAAKNFDTLVEAFTYINKYGNSQAEYTITLNSDISVSSLTLPAATKAANITFNGEGSLKLNMTSLSIPTNVTFDVPVEGTNATALTISVVAGKTLTINGEGSRNIGKISGTATSVLNIKQFLTVGGIATFKEVNVADEKAVSVEGNVTGVTHFNGALWLKNPKYTATITNIGKADLVLYDIDGANAKVTISNIDEDGSLNVTLVDSLFNEIAVASGRTILWAGSTVDFTSKVTIANKTSTSQDLTAYLYGKEIKAEYGGAVTLSRLLEDKSWQEIRTYPNLDLAFKAMTDANVEYKVFLNEDISVSNLVLPTKAKSITFTSSALDIKTLTVSSTAVTLSNNVTFENIKLETTNASGLTITANKNVDITMLHSSTLKTINGTSASYISFDVGEGYPVGYSISGFGTLIVCDGVVGFNTDANGTTSVKAGTLKLIGGEIMGARFIAGSCSAVFTNIESVGSNTEIIYDKSNQNPITVNGKVTAENPILISASGGKTFKQNDIVLISKTADLSKFKLNENSLPDDGIEYTLAREGSDVKVKGAVYELSDGGEGSVKYASWSDVVAAMNDSTTDYTVKLLADVTEGNITFPAATKAKSVKLTGGKTFKIANTTLTLPTNVTFGDIQIETTNTRSGLTITANKNVDIWGLESSTLKTINGTSASYISLHGSDGYQVSYSTSGFGTLIVQSIVVFNTDANGTISVSAGTLKLMGVEKLSVGSCSAVFTNIESVGSNNKIVYSDISNIKPITVNGKVTADNPISISSGGVNKFKQDDTVLISKTADLSKFKIAENSLPDDGIEYTLAREGSNVKVKGAVYELSDGGEGSVKYASWSDVVAAMNSSTTDYTVKLLADVTEGNITFPAVTKANSVTLTGGKKLTIANTTLTLPTNVTFGDIQIETTNTRSGLTITASKNFTVNGLTSASLKAVNGGAKSVLKVAGSSEFIYYSISGFNTIDVVEYGVNFINTVKATNLIIKDNASVFVSSKLVSFTNVEAGVDTCIMYNKTKSVPLAISGKVTASDPISLLALDDNGNPTTFEVNDIVLTSTTADLSKFKIAENSLPEDGIEYTLAREGSNVKVKGAVYELSDGGEGSVKYASWSDVVAAMNSSTTDYTVKLLADVTEGNITFPAATKAQSVKLTGSKKLTIANSTLTLPTDVEFNGLELETTNEKTGLTITANKNFVDNYLFSTTLKAVKGSSKSVLTIRSSDMDITYNISGFGTVAVEQSASFNMYGDNKTILEAGTLEIGSDNQLLFSALTIGNCNAKFTNIKVINSEKSSRIAYADAKNFTPVTITGTVTSEKPINISSLTTKFSNGDTVLIAKTADLSKFEIVEGCLPEGDVEYTLERDGANVKVMGAVYQLSSGENVIGKYSSWAKVVAAMNDKNTDYTVTLLADVTEGNITFPAANKAKSVAVYGNGNTFTIANTALTLPTDVIFGSTKLESSNTRNGLKITASKNLIIQGFYGLSSKTLKTINGSANSVLKFYCGAGYNVTYSISGFGTVVIPEFDIGFNVGGETATTVKATNLVLGGASTGATLLVGNCNATFTNVTYSKYESGNVYINYADTTNIKPISITGKVTADSPIIIGAKNGTFADNDTVLISKTADLSKFKVNEINLPESTLGYTLASVGTNVKIMGVKFKLSYGTTEAYFAQWSDILNTIAENAKNGNKDEKYAVVLLDDVNIGGALTMPKAGTFGSLTVQGNGDAKTLTFTGTTVSLTGTTSFSNLILKSEKDVRGVKSYVDFSFNAGKNTLILAGVTGKIKDIISGGTVSLGGTTINGNVSANSLEIYEGTEPTEPISAGGIQAMNSFVGKALAATSVRIKGNLSVTNVLTLNSSLTVKGSFSAAGINSAADSENVALVLCKNEKKPAVIGKNGFGSNSEKIKFALVDPKTGLTVQIAEDTVIATISGKYADNLIPCDDNLDTDEQSVGYYIVKENGKLIAKPKNAPQGFVQVICNGKTAYYTSLDAAIKDINATGTSSDEYIVTLTPGMFSTTIPKLPLPNAGKYGKLTYCGSSLGNPVNINVTSDINLTGDLVLDRVIINKVDRNENVLPISVNLGKYTLEVVSNLSQVDGADRIANINGTGKFITNSDTIVTGRVNVGTIVFKNNTVTLKGKTASFTGSVSVDTEGTLEYDKANAKNVKFNNVSGDPLTVKVADVAAGDVIAAITGDYTNGKIKIDGSELFVARSDKNLVAASLASTIMVIEYENDKEKARLYDTLENAMKDINRLNNKNGYYMVSVGNANGKTYSKLPLPAAGKYGIIEFIGGMENANAIINVTSDITLTGDCLIGTFITINKVDKNGKVVEMSVNVGNYVFNCEGKLSYDETKSVSQLKNVSGKGKFGISGDATVSGNVNVGTIDLNGTITLGEKAAFAGNVVTLDLGDYSTTLKYPVAVGKNVKLGTIKDGYTGGFLPGMLNVEIDGVKAGDQIAALTGDYIADTVVINDGAFTAVRSGTKLLAVAKGTEVTVSDGTNTRAYDTYANAIADITRLNNANGEYVITLPEGTNTLTSLTLPARGKYASIVIAASGAADIEVKSDVALTGNVVIGTGVTLKKVKVFGGDPVTPFKFTSAKNRDGSPVYTVKTNGGTIVNGNLNGAEIQDISGD